MISLKNMFKTKEKIKDVNIKKDNSEKIEFYSINRDNAEMIRCIDGDKLKKEVILKFAKGDKELHKVYAKCTICGSDTYIDINKKMTEEDFINTVNLLPEYCDENCFNKYKMKEKEKQIIKEREEYINNNMVQGAKVKVYVNKRWERGTILSKDSYYNHTWAENRRGKRIEFVGNYIPYFRILLDGGLEKVDIENMDNIKICDDVFTENEIDYIVSTIKNKAIDNYKNDEITDISKRIIDKLLDWR